MRPTSNFGFLSGHDPKLVQLGAFAERYFRDDPPTCLIKVRQLAELVAKLIAAHHALYTKERETFEERLRRLHYDRIIPREVNDILHKLRILGNAAAHEAVGNHSEALTGLKLARELAVWFHRTYALFAGLTFVGVVEAKRKRKNVSAAIDQAERYSKGPSQQDGFSFAGGPWGDHKVPFVFAANGRSYLKQIETESGIWFRDTRRTVNHRRALVDWPTPEGLLGLIEIDQDAATEALEALPFEFGFPLRDYQQHAIEAVEKALKAERRSMLLAMATGTGKTKLAIAMLYRLLATKRFRRICFVVDRSALGQGGRRVFNHQNRFRQSVRGYLWPQKARRRNARERNQGAYLHNSRAGEASAFYRR
jgi:hypothetical protein